MEKIDEIIIAKFKSMENYINEMEKNILESVPPEIALKKIALNFGKLHSDFRDASNLLEISSGEIKKVSWRTVKK